MRRTRAVEQEVRVEAVHAQLAREGAVEPLELGGPAERIWADCDLASLAENRLGELVDPRQLGDELRADWAIRATSEPVWEPSARELERCYWIVEGDRRAGTIALANSALGGQLLRISSLYVLPSERRRGVARRAIERVRRACATQGLGIRLETSWTWQTAVRFYLDLGMWVRMWKREIDFYWPAGAPAQTVEVGGERIELGVALNGARHVLAIAARAGDALLLEDGPAAADPELGRLAFDARSTLALVVARRAWPLVRSMACWEKSYFADAGPPESLAYKIALWEAWERRHGWQTNTPRIPGLAYPSWDELMQSPDAALLPSEHSDL